MPEPEPAVATAAPNPVPALEKRYAIDSCVFLKHSNGEETLAYVIAYDAEEALYMVEIETLGSGKAEKCHDKDLRALDTTTASGNPQVSGGSVTARTCAGVPASVVTADPGGSDGCAVE